MTMTALQKKRLQECRCPFQGLRLFWNFRLPLSFRGGAFPASCGRRGCVVVARAQSPNGPAKLIPECVHYLDSMQRLSAIERELAQEGLCVPA
jgi:hypothetical protein